MQKNHLRDYIKNLLPKVDKTNKFHPNVIDHAIEHAFNTVFTEIARKAPRELDGYTKSYDLSLTQDGSGKNYYTTLTAAYVPLPDKRSGVRFVEAQGDYSEIKFVPVTQKEFYIYPNTYSATISDRIIYYLDVTKLYFYKPSAAVITSGVTVHQVIPFTAYADTDTLLVPDGQDDAIIKLALAHLGVVPPVDLSNDNNDRQE